MTVTVGLLVYASQARAESIVSGQEAGGDVVDFSRLLEQDRAEVD